MTSRERFERALRQHLPLIDTTRTVGSPYVSAHTEEMWQLWQACEAEMREVMKQVAVCFAAQLIQARRDVEVISGKPLDKIIDEEMSR